MLDILVIGLVAFTFWGINHILSTLGKIQNKSMKFALTDLFSLLIYVSVVILENEHFNLFHFLMLLLFREVNNFALKLLFLKFSPKRTNAIILNMGIILTGSICFLYADNQTSITVALAISLFLLALNFSFFKGFFSDSHESEELFR